MIEFLIIFKSYIFERFVGLTFENEIILYHKNLKLCNTKLVFVHAGIIKVANLSKLTLKK